MSDEKQNYKLTDEEFDEIYKENFGLCALTSRAIEKQYGIKYSRQAVRERSKKYTQQEKDAMLDDLLDVSISVVVGHMQGEECPPSRLKGVFLLQNLNRFIRYTVKYITLEEICNHGGTKPQRNCNLNFTTKNTVSPCLCGKIPFVPTSLIL
jgi:hypothetical protein